MELTQLVNYLDYGVLGLSAIILILSFVLLSREQKREVFRPEVAKAIRRYMMLALAFAAVGLVSTIVEGVMVRPAEKERKKQEERMEQLSDIISEELEKKLDDRMEGVKGVDPIEIDAVTNPDANIESEIDPSIPDSIREYNRIKKFVFRSLYDLRADKEIFSNVLDNMEEKHPEITPYKGKIINDFDDIADMKLDWLEKKAIPAAKSDTLGRVIIDLPEDLVISKKGNNKVVVPEVQKMEKEVEILRRVKK